MKLYLILLSAGQIGGVLGPLPYDVAQCQRNADSMYRQIAEQAATGRYADGTLISDKPDVAKKAMGFVFECVFRDRRPELGDPAGRKALERK
jgi:hypothetical protein